MDGFGMNIDGVAPGGAQARPAEPASAATRVRGRRRACGYGQRDSVRGHAIGVGADRRPRVRAAKPRALPASAGRVRGTLPSRRKISGAPRPNVMLPGSIPDDVYRLFIETVEDYGLF